MGTSDTSTKRAIPSRSTRSSDRSISFEVQSVSAAGVGDTAVVLDGVRYWFTTVATHFPAEFPAATDEVARGI